MGFEAAGVVAQVASVCVVVADLDVPIFDEALRDHQVVRFVACRRRALTHPHRQEHDESQPGRGERRGARITHERESPRLDPASNGCQHAQPDRAPYQPGDRAGPGEKDLGHRHRQPREEKQRREEQQQKAGSCLDARDGH